MKSGEDRGEGWEVGKERRERDTGKESSGKEGRRQRRRAGGVSEEEEREEGGSANCC